MLNTGVGTDGVEQPVEAVLDRPVAGITAAASVAEKARFRRSSPDDLAVVQEEHDEKPADTSTHGGAPARYAIRHRNTSRDSRAERSTVPARIARLLLEAAGVTVEEHSDDKC